MAKIWAVVYTADDEATTEHSAHLTMDDAGRAGAELARREWAANGERDNEVEDFPETHDDWDAIDALRTAYDVHLEVEQIEISDDVIRALAARL